MIDTHLRVRVGREDYALAIGDVLEVGELGQITVVSGARQEILGVRNLRGHIVAIVDTASLFDLPRGARLEWMVVVEDAGRRAGLAVSSVGELGAVEEATEAPESEYLAATGLVGGAPVGVVDLPAVFAELAPEGGAA